MSDDRVYESHAAGQHPHTPGQDPLGTGKPREPEHRQARPDDTDAAADLGTGGGDDTTSGEDAPLGGDESTESRLDADTAIEKDALKSLDPDDTPA